ncbi:hypothetical protein [Roseiterribacter gracilis]|uniref:Rho termination factor N-terminal domain-containing protein n=1 Tax=Roseiterribacter gracilis TaxID=2812848 RepID=A0A8S8XEB0_9PROT|nr:hypothetical protein TMPK1_16770 [Rhodospirillales bacterium TMPK1]
MAKTVAKPDRKSRLKKPARTPMLGGPTRAELYERARMRDIIGASRMTKDELLLALRTH